MLSLKDLLESCLELMLDLQKVNLRKLFVGSDFFQKIVSFCVKNRNSMEGSLNEEKAFKIVSELQTMHSEIEIR